MLGRREILKAAAATLQTAPLVATTLAAPAIAQSQKKIAFLTWNFIDQETMVRNWIKSFEAANPGVEVEWLDKKGPDLPAVLPDPARRRHAARRGRYAGRALAGIRRATARCSTSRR